MSSEVKFQVGKLKFEIKIQPRYLFVSRLDKIKNFVNDLKILVCTLYILHRIYVALLAQRINARLNPCQKMCRFLTFFVNHYYEWMIYRMLLKLRHGLWLCIVDLPSALKEVSALYNSQFIMSGLNFVQKVDGKGIPDRNSARSQK